MRKMPVQIPYLSDYLRNKQVVQLMKPYLAGNAQQSLHNFYAGNVINTFKHIQLFDYLSQPRSLEEVAEKYQFTDKVLLRTILELFKQEHIVVSPDQDHET